MKRQQISILIGGLICLIGFNQANAAELMDDAQAGRLVSDLYTEVIASSKGSELCKAKNTVFEEILDSSIHGRGWKDDIMDTLHKTVLSALKSNCLPFSKAEPDRNQQHWLLKKSVADARVNLVNDARSTANKACICSPITSFDSADLKTRDIAILEACEDSLFTIRKRQEKKDKSSICEAEYARVQWELTRRMSSKDHAIDQAVSIIPNAFDYQFNLGYASTSVNSLWNKGNPRVSLGLYRTFSTNVDRYSKPGDPKTQSGFNWYGVHLSTHIRLTDAGEQQQNIAVGTNTKIGADRALDYEALVLFPVYAGGVKSYGKSRRFYFAPSAMWASKKIDTNNLMLTRHYFGVRTFIGPEAYMDLMVGRSEKVSGTRLMIRGKMPFNFPSTDQIIYLGLEGNLSLRNRKNNTSPETIRGYISWDIDNIFSLIQGEEKDAT